MVEAESDEDFIEDINESEIKIPCQAFRYIKNEEINLDSHNQKRSDLLLKRAFNPQKSINMLLNLKNLTFIMNEHFCIGWVKGMETLLCSLVINLILKQILLFIL